MSILEKLDKFYIDFNGEKGSIGKSTFNKEIYYFRITKSKRPKIIIQYSIHAREYITTYLALKQIIDYEKNGMSGDIVFIPCVNPDGVKICLDNKPLYKANGRKVDLNVNFDAGFGRGEFNKTFPDDSDYIGKYPFSEKESKNLRDFTLRFMPDITVSYHSKGEEIYWYFNQKGKLKKQSKMLAKSLEKATGYTMKKTLNSFGGYKDWCIDKLGILSFTIEVGEDCLSHPIKEDNLDRIYGKNKRVIEVLLKGKYGKK